MEDWQEQRHFCGKTLRNCEFGKSIRMEALILEELKQLCEDIKKEMASQGKVHLSNIFKMTSGNILLAMVTGERKETEISHLLEQFICCIQRAANSGLIFYPWIKYLAPKMSGYTAYVQVCEDMRRFLWKCFEEREKTGHYDGQDMISLFLKQVQETEDKQSSFYGSEGLKQAFNSVLALLLGGTESTSSMMSWIIFYLSVHPEVQVKVKGEIHRCLADRDPTLEDRCRMPYTEAMIEESLRMSSVAPIGIMHELLEDVTFQDYKFPKGILLIANIYHAHHDQNVWGDPKIFRPERFLKKPEISPQEEARDKVTLRNKMVTFQPGKRTCLGETFARDVLFLCVTKLVQQFTFSGVKGIQREEYMEPEVGLGLLPKNIPVLVEANE